MKSLLVLLLNLGISFAAASQTLEVRNSSGLRVSVDTDTVTNLAHSLTGQRRKGGLSVIRIYSQPKRDHLKWPS